MNAGLDNSTTTEPKQRLKPFKPGQSGNPAGRPLGSKNRSTLAREWLEMVVEGEPNVDRVMRALIAKASTGDVPAIKEILDSSFGKVADKTELTGKDGGPVELSPVDKDILATYIAQNKTVIKGEDK